MDCKNRPMCYRKLLHPRKKQRGTLQRKWVTLFSSVWRMQGPAFRMRCTWLPPCDALCDDNVTNLVLETETQRLWRNGLHRKCLLKLSAQEICTKGEDEKECGQICFLLEWHITGTFPVVFPGSAWEVGCSPSSSPSVTGLCFPERRVSTHATLFAVSSPSTRPSTTKSCLPLASWRWGLWLWGLGGINPQCTRLFWRVGILAMSLLS